MKKLLFSLLILLVSIPPVFAEETPDGCNIIQDYEEVDFVDELKEVETPGIKNFYEEEDLEKAYQNLKARCCARWILGSDDCEWVDTTTAPQSIYLYDHLIDIGFRKLDWEEETLYDWLELHPEWESWREEIQEMWEEPDGVSPTDIKELFEDYRDPEWTDWLAYKYRETCFLANNMRDSIYEVDSTPEANRINECTSLVRSRINNENNYVEYLMVDRWNDYVCDNLLEYIDDYFLQNRMVSLLEQFVYFDNMLYTIANKVHEWTETCGG